MLNVFLILQAHYLETDQCLLLHLSIDGNTVKGLFKIMWRFIVKEYPYLCEINIIYHIFNIFNTHFVFQGRTVSSSRKVPRSPTRSQPSHRDIRQNIARLKNVDSKLANRILDEILDSGPKVKFTDIGKWLYLIDTCVFY